MITNIAEFRCWCLTNKYCMRRLMDLSLMPIYQQIRKNNDPVIFYVLFLLSISATVLSALTDAGKRTTVTTKAVASDERTSGGGCSPDGCIPDNTRDSSRDANSRWSCVGTFITGVGGCRIEYNFEDPQDIVKVRIAFHKGDENVRVLKVIVDGKFHSRITSSGETLGYQNFVLDTEQTSRIIFRLDDHANKLDEWLSITEVRQCYRTL